MDAVAILGAVGTVLGACIYIYKVVSPIANFKNDVEELKKTVNLLNESNKLQCKYMVNMIDHMITGNSKENIVKTKKEILDHLTEV